MVRFRMAAFISKLVPRCHVLASCVWKVWALTRVSHSSHMEGACVFGSLQMQWRQQVQGKNGKSVMGSLVLHVLDGRHTHVAQQRKP